MTSPTKSFLALGTAALLSVLVIAGCGGDSQPEYCERVDTLRDSVAQLTDIQLEPGLLDTARSDVETVRSNAEAAVDAAREDFPSETDALESSIDTVSESIDDLPNSPSATELAAVAIELSAVVNAAQNFEDATASSCE